MLDENATPERGMKPTCHKGNPLTKRQSLVRRAYLGAWRTVLTYAGPQKWPGEAGPGVGQQSHPINVNPLARNAAPCLHPSHINRQILHGSTSSPLEESAPQIDGASVVSELAFQLVVLQLAGRYAGNHLLTDNNRRRTTVMCMTGYQRVPY